MFKGNFTYDDLYKEKYKKDPLIDFSKKEASFSMKASICMVIIIFFLDIPTNIDILNNDLREMILYIGTAFIGVIGFVLSGIAIISGTLNMKALQTLESEGKYDQIILILMGFWYIAKLIAGV